MTTALIPAPRLPWGAGADPCTRYIARLRAGSRPSQASALRTIAKMVGGDPGGIPWHALTLSEAAALATKVREAFKPRTAARMLAAVRGVLDVCRSERWLLVPTDPSGQFISQLEHYNDLCKQLTCKIPTGTRVGRILTDDEMVAMFAFCDEDGLRGVRDSAILAIALGSGLRREEISDLNIEHIHKDGRVDVIGGKGDKDRVTALGEQALGRVNAWKCYCTGRPPPGTPLIVNVVRTSNPSGESRGNNRLSPAGIWEVMRRIQTKSGVEPFTPHDCRRTFATRQLQAGTPLKTVQTMLGHANIETTQRYNLTEVTTMLESVKKVDLP